MKEQWKNIKGYEGYKISNFGNVISFRRNKKEGRLMKPFTSRYGYLKVELLDKSTPVHRLVGEAFVKNPKKKPFINHLDNNRSNNIFTNLEWCTQKENVNHSYKQGRMYKAVGELNGMSKKFIDTKTGIIYSTGKEASLFIGMKPRTFYAMMSGQNPNKTNFKIYGKD